MANNDQIHDVAKNTSDTVANAGSTASTTMHDTTANAQKMAGEASEKAGKKVEDLKAQASEFADRAGAQLREVAESGREKAAEGVHALADVTRSAAARFDADGKVGAYANRAADGLDQFSSTLKDRNFDDLAADARSFIRQHPVVTVGAAAVIGYALTRFLTSGSNGDHDA